MAVSRRLKKFLKDNKVKFKSFKHDEVFTTQEVAASQHVPGNRMVKTVVVKLDGQPALAVVPAPRMIDFAKLKKVAGAKKGELASEKDIHDCIPDCEVGTMTPLGPLYGIPVYADTALSGEKDIFFNAESHTDTLQIAFGDFQRITELTMGDISASSS